MRTIQQELEELKEDFPNLALTHSQFEFRSVIGKGGFGEVYSAFDKNSKRLCAIKQIFSERIGGNKMRRFIAEIRTMAMCDNMFLVPLIGFTPDPPYSVITEFMPNGSLDKYIRKRDEIFDCPLSGSQLTKIAIGIAHGMRHLHSQGIIHRDLKAANILLDDNYYPRICDFGIARFQDIGAGKGMTQKIGTPNYMAPELIVSNVYDNKVDVYSFAMILFEMSECTRAFKGLKLNDLFTKVINNALRPSFTDQTPEPMRDLIEKCWAQDPAERPTFDEIYETFVNGIVEFNGCDAKEIAEFVSVIEKDESVRGPERDRKFGAKKVNNSDSDQEEEEEEESAEVNSYSKTGSLVERRSETSANKSELSLTNLTKTSVKEWTVTLTDVCREIPTTQVVKLLDIVSKRIIDEPSSETRNFILHNISKLMERGSNFVKEVAKHEFMSLLPVTDEEIVDSCILVYKPIFAKCPRLLDEQHIINISSLLQKRPMQLFCLFSLFVRAFKSLDQRSWCMVDLLYQAHNAVMDTPAGKMLLSLFYYLLVHSKQYAKSRGAHIRAVFAEYLASNDKGTVACAYNGLVRLGIANEQPVDMSIVLGHLRDAVLWRNALNFLANLQQISNPTAPLVRGLIKRASSSKVPLVVLLKVAETVRGADLLMNNSGWMRFGRDFPVDVFRVFLMLFMDKRRQKPLSLLVEFPFLLRAVMEVRDDSIISAVPFVIQRSASEPDFVERLQKSGFLRMYNDVVREKDNVEVYQQFFTVVEHLAGIVYVRDFLICAETVVKVMNGYGLVGQCLVVILALCMYKDCVDYFNKIGLGAYCEVLRKYPQYGELVRDILNKL